MDPLILSRLQFAFTIMFHYLFPPLTIGLGGLMVLMEGFYLKTGDRQYESMARFWTRLFSVNFAMGVATGIVMEFQFGTNWSGYSRFVGDVFGSALAAEGIFAFFLESGFLAVVVFGWDRVGKGMHFFATCMVALGAVFSSVWIVVANSWQQTPAGYHLVEQAGRVRAEITSFWGVVLNPSSLYRLNHVLLGAYLLAAFFVMSVSAFYLLKGRHLEFARRSLKIGLATALVLICLQIVSGDAHSKEVAFNQPPKLAAFEGHFHTGSGGTEMYLFGLPDARQQAMKYGVAVPGLLSLLVYGDANKPVAGLDQFKPEDWPPVLPAYLSFRLMVGLGFAMLALCLVGAFLWWRGRLFQARWLQWILVFAVAMPWIANESGWVAAEVGRQPWIVYGLLRTSQALSVSVPPWQILTSIILFSLIYFGLGAIWVYVFHQKIVHGPDSPLAPFREGYDLAGAATSLMRPEEGHSLTQPPKTDFNQEGQ